MIVCGMGNISPWVFAEILRDVPFATDEWQVRVWHEDMIDVVELRVETNLWNEPQIHEDVRKGIEKNISERFPDFQKNRAMNLYELRIITVKRGSLRTARKLKRLVSLSKPPAGMTVFGLENPVEASAVNGGMVAEIL